MQMKRIDLVTFILGYIPSRNRNENNL